ncbi:sigma-70 family RNA polymerase sigma factor [Paracoccus methylovorus]|uniref:Sigma-70 family RNA polymerase sigma factor n=1 Tax=Paracoccus methylovorus TaxID=2812658 RepID=A0ABX7JFD7_9RHOB|nr:MULTISPECIES: sigma-70 family RNA polymerase sigma factor [Paracoccus]QRZ12955.1 sigma-70 family RNA polymerase sigma factor [Paracoccus methylovorus]
MARMTLKLVAAEVKTRGGSAPLITNLVTSILQGKAVAIVTLWALPRAERCHFPDLNFLIVSVGLSEERHSINTAMSSIVLQLGSLFRSERDRLVRRVRHVIRSRTDAEDLVQDVFLNVLHREDRRDVQSPRNYLARAATNAALDHLRRQRVRSEILDCSREIAADVAAEQPGTEAIVQSRQELVVLHHTVEQLPRRTTRHACGQARSKGLESSHHRGANPE